MGTIALVLVVVIITVIICRWIEKRKEKKISIVVMSTDPGQAWRMFADLVANKIPIDCLEINRRPTDTEYIFILKK
jgi:hypothetical protein